MAQNYRNNNEPITLSTEYLKKGYFDETGKPRKELYITWAEEIADRLIRVGMTQSALRNFYNEIKVIQSLIRSDDTKKKEEQFQNQKHRLYKLRAIANNFVNKPENKKKFIFYDFINKNLPFAEKDEKHFNTFVDHFMCILGYFKGK